ncbi:MAG: Lrp/AsnC ligand binding domain-containing protein [Candidatus Heimdallarchaeota archaeon]
MATVFMLINSELGAEERVLTALHAIDVIKETYIVYGMYDIIAKVVASSTEVIKKIILEEIRAIPEIRSTLTMVVAETWT